MTLLVSLMTAVDKNQIRFCLKSLHIGSNFNHKVTSSRISALRFQAPCMDVYAAHFKDIHVLYVLYTHPCGLVCSGYHTAGSTAEQQTRTAAVLNRHADWTTLQAAINIVYNTMLGKISNHQLQ